MPHKADKSFFETKRPWSQRKDAILAYYLKPYLAKVSRLRKTIHLVDGFAGPGKFGDGEIGSPLTMCGQAQVARSKGSDVQVTCIEKDPELHATLEKNLSGFSFAEAKSGSICEHLQLIEDYARQSTVFLYLDPFAIEGLDWHGLSSIFNQIKESKMSIELLLNFQAVIFIRRGLSALGQNVPTLNPDVEDTTEPEAPPSEAPSLTKLNFAVGGNWWQKILTSTRDFRSQVEAVTQQLTDNLREKFGEAGCLAIRAKATHKVPKYYLVFATRHPEGLELMNDAMVKTGGMSVFYRDLFSRHDLMTQIDTAAHEWIPRGDVILTMIRENFCQFARKEIRGCIEEMLGSERLESKTGKKRINDDVAIRKVQT